MEAWPNQVFEDGGKGEAEQPQDKDGVYAEYLERKRAGKVIKVHEPDETVLEESDITLLGERRMVC